MMLIGLCSLFFALSSAVRSVNARCASPSEEFTCPPQCDCWETLFKCTKLHLDSIPELLPFNVTKVVFTTNRIRRVTRQDFAGCSELLKINLAHNLLSHIDDRAFVDTPMLNYLNLTANSLNFSTLPSRVFDGLSSLRILTIEKNDWKGNFDYRGDLFEPLTSLTTLSIDGVPGAIFPREFSNLRKLSDLNVYGGLTVIANDTFAALNGSAIERIVIDTRKHLVDVAPMSFGHFRKLNTLDLSNNFNLGLMNVSKAWYGLRFTNIRSLSLISVTPDTGISTHLGAEFFQYLNRTRISRLFITENFIAQIEPLFSASLPHLNELSLAGNQLIFSDELMFDLAKLKYLEKIHLDHQFCPSYVRYPPAVGLLGNYGVDVGADFLPSPCITYQNKTCARHTTVDLVSDVGKFEHKDRGQPICLTLGPALLDISMIDALRLINHVLPPITVFGGRKLQAIRLSSNSLIKINGPIIFKDPPIDLKIDLTSNQIECISPDAFKISASMGAKVRRLHLAGNSLGNQLAADVNGSTFRYLRHLIVLNLGHNAIKSLPTNVFVNVPHLRTLRVGGNALKTIDFQFDHMLELNVFDLSENLFTVLNGDLITSLSAAVDRNPNMTINLTGNPLQCSCDTLRMLHWIGDNRMNMANFSNTSCLYGEAYVPFSRLSDYILPELTFECAKSTAVLVGGILLGLALVLVALSAFCYRHRWEIRYACLKLTQRGQRYERLVDLQVDYEYDAFVVYDSEDRQWVNDQLLPHLEHTAGQTDEAETSSVELVEIAQNGVGRNVRLCVHERDFPPGQEIVANIWNKMERSRNVILVISKNFSLSRYCEYEMNLGRMLSVEKGHNVLVPVVLEWPVVETVSDCLNWVLRKLTYIRWPEHEGERGDFWQHLQDALAMNDELNPLLA